MSRKVNSYRDLQVWQKGIELTLDVYRITAKAPFPASELYGLVSQMRRASVSVPANIAEGQARAATRDFVRFLRMARGSLAELDTPFFIARSLGYLQDQDNALLCERVDELQRMLFALIQKLDAPR